MALDDYKKLIEQFCDDVDIDDVSDVLERGLIKIGGNLVSLEYIEELDQCRIAIDLGPPFENFESELYRFMLEANIDNGTDFISIFGLNSKTGHVVLMLYVPIHKFKHEIKMVSFMNNQILSLLNAWEKIFDDVSEERDEIEFPTLSKVFV